MRKPTRFPRLPLGYGLGLCVMGLLSLAYAVPGAMPLVAAILIVCALSSLWNVRTRRRGDGPHTKRREPILWGDGFDAS